MSREMKDSGIEWIGEIPKEWEVKRAKSIFAQRSSKGNTTAILLSATQKHGMLPQSMLEGVVQTNANTDLQTFKTVHKNDYVISLRSFQGGFEMSNYEGVCSPAYQVFYNHVPISHQFFWLLFKSCGFIDKINSLTVGIREGKNIQYKDFANMMLAVPLFSEQQKIADYLDKVCGEIDDMIALQEKMIEELKAYKQSVITEAVTKGLNPNVPMRDSGIDWIGEIPKEWGIYRIKYNTFLKGRIGWQGLNSRDFIDDGYCLITGTDFDNRGGIHWETCYRISKERFEEDELLHVKEGDLLMTKDGTVGKMAIIDHLPEEASLNSHLLIIRQTTNIMSNKFLYWAMLSDVFKGFCNIYQSGSIMNSISQSTLGFFSCPCPNDFDQQKIAKYLDKVCTEIDELIAIKQKKIEELKDYKKSMIYEYVTGKKQVN